MLISKINKVFFFSIENIFSIILFFNHYVSSQYNLCITNMKKTSFGVLKTQNHFLTIVLSFQRFCLKSSNAVE